MIVLDASAAVELLLERSRGVWVSRQIGEHTEGLHAPHLIDIEFVSATRRLVAGGFVTSQGAALALRELVALRLIRYPHVGLLDRIWELRHAITPSDAAYVALAELLDAVLVTTDERLARAAGHRARIVSPATI